jgi:glutamate carboxypeptidase
MYQHKNEIKSFIDQHRKEMLNFLIDLVNMEGHYNEKAQVEKVRNFYQAALEKEGFKCKVFEVAPDRAGILVAVLGEDRPGKSIILEGHLDTVHRTGSFGKTNPCHVENDKIYGPGVLDMKGGMVMALYIAKALNSIGFNACPIKIIAVCDEEADHVGNDGDKILTENCVGGGIALSFEVAPEDNCLATRRKAQLVYHINIKGKGGHAGNNFWESKNAIFEANRIINEVTQLTDKEQETTVTASVINAGEQQTAVPETCRLVFDIRIVTASEKERVIKRFEEVLNHPSEGYSITYDLEVAKLKPLQETESVLAVWNFVNEAAKACGYPAFGKTLRGGANDAGNIASAGVPTIDSCGMMGTFAHNIKEYAILESLYTRTEIFATALSEAESFKA